MLQSLIAKFLTQLAEEDREFFLGRPAEQSLAGDEEVFIELPNHSIPRSRNAFYINTDVNGFGICAVLPQIQGGKEQVVFYWSLTLTKEEGAIASFDENCEQWTFLSSSSITTCTAENFWCILTTGL